MKDRIITICIICAVVLLVVWYLTAQPTCIAGYWQTNPIDTVIAPQWVCTHEVKP